MSDLAWPGSSVTSRGLDKTSSAFVSNIQIHRVIDTDAFGRKTGDHFLATFYKIERRSIRHLKDNRLGRALGYIKTSSASIFIT